MKFYRTVIIGRLIPLKWDIFIVRLPFAVLFSLFDTKNKIQEKCLKNTVIASMVLVTDLIAL